MQLVECAMNDYGLFDELEIIKNITIEDVTEKLNSLNCENTVLSVINPKN